MLREPNRAILPCLLSGNTSDVMSLLHLLAYYTRHYDAKERVERNSIVLLSCFAAKSSRNATRDAILDTNKFSTEKEIPKRISYRNIYSLR